MTPTPAPRRYPPLSDDQKARIVEIAMAALRRQARTARRDLEHDHESGGDDV